jgi:hypothetical protein
MLIAGPPITLLLHEYSSGVLSMCDFVDNLQAGWGLNETTVPSTPPLLDKLLGTLLQTLN